MSIRRHFIIGGTAVAGFVAFLVRRLRKRESSTYELGPISDQWMSQHHAQSRTLKNADSLRSLLLTVIKDARAPVAVRNQCHRLMFAIEKNNQALVDESLVVLEQVAERTGYPLPPSKRISDDTRST